MVEPVDLDRFETWPEGLVCELVGLTSQISAERAAGRQHRDSDQRWFEPVPTHAATDSAIASIDRAMMGRRIRIFHATRLADHEEVRRAGLKPLALDEQIARLEVALEQGGRDLTRDELRKRIASVDRSKDYFAVREGQVWGTPLRRNLHDGGCDIFFEHWGGEALERLLSHAEPGLQSILRTYGQPSVVVASIPASGVCLLGDTMVAKTMLELVLEAEGMDAWPTGWDVLLRQPIPPSWIEQILDPQDPFLAS